MDLRSIIWAFIGIIAVLAGSCSGESDSDNLDDGEIAAFRAFIENADCSDVSNRLFSIDDKFVFWDKRGSCADASFAFTLFGDSPEEVLCSRMDSIAGPQENCPDESVRDIFETIVNNLDKDDLGLGAEHQVEML